MTASKFYTLKESQSLSCHYSKNPDRVLALKQEQSSSSTKDMPRVFNNGASDISDATFQGSGPGGRRTTLNYGGAQAAASRAT